MPITYMQFYDKFVSGWLVLELWHANVIQISKHLLNIIDKLLQTELLIIIIY